MSSVTTTKVDSISTGKPTEPSRSLKEKIMGATIKTLFVVGSAGLVLDSVRNSLTWSLGKFWGDAGSAWQEMWANLLSVVNTIRS